MTGGRERSCFTGSVFEEGLPLRLLVEGRLWRSVVAVLLVFARVEGGFMEDLVDALSVELGGRDIVEVLRVVRLMVGRRLGDWLLLSAVAGRRIVAFFSESTVVVLPYLLPLLLPFSEGLRRDRVREGIVDMAAMLFVDSRSFTSRYIFGTAWHKYFRGRNRKVSPRHCFVEKIFINCTRTRPRAQLIHNLSICYAGDLVIYSCSHDSPLRQRSALRKLVLPTWMCWM